MRNYIHINLCISLIVAQVTFVAGVEPRGSVVGTPYDSHMHHNPYSKLYSSETVN